MEDQKDYFNLENIDFRNPSQRINSPRSLEACRRKGVKLQDLYHIDIDVYKNSSHDLKHLPKDVLELRYSYIEKMREENIQICIEERKNLIRDRIVVPNEKPQHSPGRHASPVVPKRGEIVLEGTSELERFKQKQKTDIQNLLDVQINNEKRIKETLDKEQRELRKLEEMRLNNIKRQQEQAKYMKIKEENKKIKQLEEQKRIDDMYKMFERAEKLQAQVDLEKEKKRKEELEFNKQIEAKRLAEFKKKTERAFNEEKQYLIEKLKFKELKDKIRKERDQKKTKEMKEINHKVDEFLKEKLKKTKQETEERIKQIQFEIAQKERYREIQQRKMEEKNHIELMKLINPNEQIVLNTHSTQSSERQRNGSGSTRGSRRITSSPMNKMAKSMNVKEVKTKIVKELQKKISLDREKNVDELKRKLEYMDKKLNDNKTRREKQNMLISELNMLKEEGFRYNHSKIENVQAYINERNKEILLEKQRIAEEKKSEKKELQQNKRNVEEEIKRKKFKMMYNLDKIMRSPSSFSPEKLKQIFPDDEDILKKFNFLNSASLKNEDRLHSEPRVNRSFDDKRRNLNSAKSERDYFFD